MVTLNELGTAAVFVLLIGVFYESFKALFNRNVEDDRDGKEQTAKDEREISKRG